MTFTGDHDLPAVGDQDLLDALQTTRPYTALVLKAAGRYELPGPHRSADIEAIVFAHGKRNYALWLAGLLRIVCPVADGTGVTGISIFDASPEDVDRIMRDDPGVRAGLFTYEIHATRTFPASSLAISEPTTAR